MVKSKLALPCAFALLTFLLHLFFSSWQGYFSDELYFIDCANHPAWGYFDIGPLLPFLIRVSRALCGDSLTALRMFPALGHAGTVLITGLIAAELGGSSFAMALASLCVLGAPGFLVLGGLFLTPSLEPFFWSLSCYLVVLILSRKRPGLWPWVGFALGVGFLNKPAILLLGFALLAALLASPSRSMLFNRWASSGALAFLAIASPNLHWQLTHEWNTFLFSRSIAESALVKDMSWAAFLLAPVFALNPLSSSVWVTGAVGLVLADRLKAARPLGYVAPLLLSTLWVIGGKAYYAAGIYPILFAAGAVVLESASARRPTKKPLFRVTLILLLAVSFLALAPGGLPLWSAERTERLFDSELLHPVSQSLQLLGIRRDTQGSSREAFLRNLAKVFGRLSPSERETVWILTSHYFQASWINILGEKYGLPRAASGNNAYFQWGPGRSTAELTLAIGFRDDFLRSTFQQVEAVPEDPSIRICRHPREPLDKLWPKLKSFPF